MFLHQYMNSNKVFQFSSVRDSSFLYKRKVPKYIYFFIVFILLLLAATIVWSNIAVKANVIKQNGTIVSSNKVSLTCNVNSNITKINYLEGNYVNKDSIIVELNSSEVDVNIEQTKTTYDYYLLRTSLFERLIDYIQNDYAIDEENNSFDPSNSNELEFYNYMYSYITSKTMYTGDSLIQFKNQTINSYIPQLDDARIKESQYRSQYEGYLKIKDNYSIKSPIDGYIHFNYSLNNGYFVQAGTELLSISPSNEDLICETYFTNADISKIKQGDKVKGTIIGLAQNDYGSLEGELISLASDATNTQDGQIFKGLIKYKTNELKSKKNTVHLRPGMSIENRIIYEETTYFKYVLELWGFHIK